MGSDLSLLFISGLESIVASVQMGYIVCLY